MIRQAASLEASLIMADWHLPIAFLALSSSMANLSLSIAKRISKDAESILSLIINELSFLASLTIYSESHLFRKKTNRRTLERNR
jgi:hypothetical protein